MATRKMFDQEYEKRLLVSQSNTGKKSRLHELHPGDAFDPRMPSSPDSGGMSSKGSPCDRFIPRRTDENWKFRFPMIEDRKHPSDKSAEENEENVCEGVIYSSLLKNELLGTAIDAVKYQRDSRRVFNSVERKPLFQYTPEKKKQSPDQLATCSLSPLSAESQLLLRTPQKVRRKIPKMPYKVLDAPELQDDFYLNLVDWSSQNMLGVGLGSIVYLWSSSTGNVTKLCDFSSDGNTVTSVSWNDRGNYLAIGTHHGFTQVWDVYDKKLVKNLEGHTGRVGCLAWNSNILCSGSRDRSILQHDIRTPEIVPKRKLMAHRQEVCGLRWSPDYQYLASGGNDNRLYIWSPHYLTPIQTYTKHKAAVKALAWSPHHHGLLASGGGTADRCIMFWNTLTGQLTKSVDTGSQVCNLGWAKYTKEIVSTHGYSQNQILVWKYPELIQVAKLLGHSYRVLYLAMSPDGESIVTGAGDETLRFWNIFSKPPVQKENKSVLNLFGNIR